MQTIRFHQCLGAILLLAGSGLTCAEINTASIVQDMQWRLVGPFRGGLTAAITGAPGQPHTLLTRAVNGGTWNTCADRRARAPTLVSQPTHSTCALSRA